VFEKDSFRKKEVRMDLATFLEIPPIKSVSSPSKFSYYKNLQTEANPLHFFVIGGTYYDKGYAVGFTLGEYLNVFIRNIYRFVSKVGLGVEGNKLNKEKLLPLAKVIYSNVRYERILELQGFLDGCKHGGHPVEDERDIAMMLAYVELNDAACCSTIGVNFPGTTHDTYQINNLEYPFRFIFLNNPFACTFFPQNEKGERVDLAYFGLTYAGVPTVLGGMNEKGVSFGTIRSSNLKDPNSMEGTSTFYYMNDALRLSKDANEFIEYIKNVKRTNAYFAVIADSANQKDSLNLCFLGHNIFKRYLANEMIDQTILNDLKYGKYFPQENAVYWVDMPVPGIEAGPDKAYHLLKEQWKNIDNQQALAIVKKLASKYTIMSCVYNTTQQEVFFSFPVKKILAQDRNYFNLSLKQIFGSYSDFKKGNFSLLESIKNIEIL